MTVSTEATASAPVLRNVYTCEQFAAEVYQGNRSAAWVRKECRKRKDGIRTVAKHPYLIPQAEALRVMGRSQPEQGKRL
jgi:hypothetical protein